MSWLPLTTLACVVACFACGSKSDLSTGSAPAAAPMTHGDHNPRFGGVVLMNGQNLHFEVVLDRAGRHRVYFSDGVRTPLPASAASDVSITIQRRGDERERVPMMIDDRDEGWVGQGRALSGGAEIVARISYVYSGQPYWIDLPFDPRP
jgi:hypothetical protein